MKACTACHNLCRFVPRPPACDMPASMTNCLSLFGSSRIEAQQFLLAGIAVVLGPDQADWAFELVGVHHRHVDGHVEIGAARHCAAEFQLVVRQRLGHLGLGCAGLVAVEDALDRRERNGPLRVGPILVGDLAAALDLRRVLPRVGEGIEHQPLDAIGLGHGEGARPDRARGLAVHHYAGLARCLLHDRHRRLQVLDAHHDPGMARGARGMAIALVIHGPHVEAALGEIVHHRVVGAARHLQVVAAARGEGRAVHQEQHGLGRAAVAGEPLAVDVEVDGPLLGPVLLRHDLAALRLCGLRAGAACSCRNGYGGRRFEELAARQRRIGRARVLRLHGFLQHWSCDLFRYSTTSCSLMPSARCAVHAVPWTGETPGRMLSLGPTRAGEADLSGRIR